MMDSNKAQSASFSSAPTGVDWRAVLIVLVSATVLFVNNGFILIGLTAFDSSLLARFDVSVGALKLRDAFTFGTVALSGPLAGWLLDRVGLRPLFVAGMLLMAIGMTAYAWVTGIYAIYAIHILFGLCLVTSGLFANVILVAASTSTHRGLALGTIVAGSSLGQAVAPGINAWLVTGFGTSGALFADAILPLLLIPVILAVCPRLNGSTYGANRAGNAGPSYRDAMTGRNFWLLATIAMITFCVELGVATNMMLYVERELRLDASVGAQAVFGLFIAALVAQVTAGWLADRIGARVTHASSLALMAFGAAILAFAPHGWLWAGVIVFGIGWGGNYSLIQLLTADIFLGPAIGRILGTIAVIESIGAATGPFAIGGLYDAFGSYSVSFAVSVAAIAVAFVAVFGLHLPPRRSAA